MSSQSIAGVNVAQFTNDNQKFYAFSGDVISSSSAATLLEFNTNTEYIDAIFKLNITDQTVSGVNYFFTIKYNDVVVYKEFYTNPYAGRQPADSDNVHMIIPPFTTVLIESGSSSGEKTYCAVVKGKVGMPQRVGNE